MIAFGCFGLRFAFGFLELRQSAPRVRRLSILIAGVATATFLLAALAGQQSMTVFVAFVFILAFTLLMVWMGLIAVRGGRVPSRYFLAAALVAMPGTAVTAMSVWRGIPFTPAGFHAIGWAFVGEGILLALALAYRMRTAHQARLRAEQLARIDPLTNLPNRRAFLEQAAPAWAIAKRTGRPLALLVADIDFFKRINDTCGHATGDEVLVAVARLLMAACRTGDIAARWGGEEFIILLPETDAGQATQVAERLRERIARLPVGSPGQEIVASASFGVAQRQGHEHIESLIREADEQLYRAKSAGRNCVFPVPALST
jgi:diguanylate cyclase (GGDEF)-like protein